jgi:hypothetical protein
MTQIFRLPHVCGYTKNKINGSSGAGVAESDWGRKRVETRGGGSDGSRDEGIDGGGMDRMDRSAGTGEGGGKVG